MNEIRGVVSFAAKGFVWAIVVVSASALLTVSGHVLFYVGKFSVMDIRIDWLLAESIVFLLSLGILYIFVPWIRR